MLSFILNRLKIGTDRQTGNKNDADTNHLSTIGYFINLINSKEKQGK